MDVETAASATAAATDRGRKRRAAIGANDGRLVMLPLLLLLLLLKAAVLSSPCAPEDAVGSEEGEEEAKGLERPTIAAWRWSTDGSKRDAIGRGLPTAPMPPLGPATDEMPPRPIALPPTPPLSNGER